MWRHNVKLKVLQISSFSPLLTDLFEMALKTHSWQKNIDFFCIYRAMAIQELHEPSFSIIYTRHTSLDVIGLLCIQVKWDHTPIRPLRSVNRGLLVYKKTSDLNTIWSPMEGISIFIYGLFVMEQFTRGY